MVDGKSVRERLVAAEKQVTYAALANRASSGRAVSQALRGGMLLGLTAAADFLRERNETCSTLDMADAIETLKAEVAGG